MASLKLHMQYYLSLAAVAQDTPYVRVQQDLSLPGIGISNLAAAAHDTLYVHGDPS